MSLLTEYRREHSLSRADMARLAGLSRDSVRCIELGLSEPTFRTRAKLAKAMGLPVTALYRRGVLHDGPMKACYTEEDCGHDTRCWIWQGLSKGGNLAYGGVYVRAGSSVYVHRLFYEIAVGPVPEGKELHHLCEQKRCCNPGHLEAVTRSRHNEITGARAILSPQQVRAIRQVRQERKLSEHRLARAFGVGRHVINGVLSGRNYAHIE
jgi:DNA-binding XRE family transcriptional regulator